MGYSMTVKKSRFRIPAEKINEVKNALVNFLRSTYYFRWARRPKPNEYVSLRDLLKDMGWNPKRDVEGNVVALELWAEKLGDDLHMFKALAPFVEPGCFIEMFGEDGDQWRWAFDGTTCRELKPKVIWE